MSKNIEQITDATFESKVLESDLPVLVDFWAPWCGPCRMLAPIMEKIAKERAGQVRVAKVNVDEHQDVAARMGIRGIPAVLLFADGELKEVAVGVRPLSDYEKMIDRVQDAKAA